MPTSAAAFANQTVLITGASRGIGEATARHFVAAGARVALVARNQQLLDEVAATLNGQAVTVAGDTSDPADCARIAAEATEKLGGHVDILVSNAGVLRRDFIEDVTPEDFEDSYRTNVGGAVWLAKALIPGMRRRGSGRIVLVSSELGLIGAPSYGSYCMSKFALVGLAEVLSHELSGTGVRACAVCPGNVRTDQMAEEVAWGAAAGASLEKALSPESVAATIADAASGNAVVLYADTTAMKLQFDALFMMPRRLRMFFIRDAYKGTLKEHRKRLSAS